MGSLLRRISVSRRGSWFLAGLALSCGGGCGSSDPSGAADGASTSGSTTGVPGTGDEGASDTSLATTTGGTDLNCDPVGLDRVVIPDGVVVIHDPDELLAYCGVREIQGTLVFEGAPGASWDGLRALGALEVVGGLLLGSIEEGVALPSLHTAEHLTLVQPGSPPPPELPRLTAAQSIAVGQYDAPVDLKSLETAETLRIGGPMLLPSLTSLRDFGASVPSLPEAPQLHRISGAVALDGEPLTDLALLRNVHTIEGGLRMYGLAELESLEDLSSLQRIGKAEQAGTDSFPSGGFSLERMDGLTTLVGLEQLAVVHGDISITENASLVALDGFENVTAWRADARQGVVTTLFVTGWDAPIDVSALSWLESAELPSACEISVEGAAGYSAFCSD